MNNEFICEQFAYKRGIPVDDTMLRKILEEYTTDPIYQNIYVDLVSRVLQCVI